MKITCDVYITHRHRYKWWNRKNFVVEEKKWKQLKHNESHQKHWKICVSVHFYTQRR